jgi:hypothetical protein
MSVHFHCVFIPWTAESQDRSQVYAPPTTIHGTTSELYGKCVSSGGGGGCVQHWAHYLFNVSWARLVRMYSMDAMQLTAFFMYMDGPHTHTYAPKNGTNHDAT